VRIVVVAVGKLKAPWADDVEHYRKLLGRLARVELIETDEDGVERRIPERAYVVALEATGDQIDSEAFAAFLEERRMAGLDLCFVIGGPYGLALSRRPDRWLSFGPMTLPHLLARVVLLEQLFRGHKILAGEPYHH
jgi:23S rRNA (pseudouridine1915-N3)-methyltransferase